MIQINNKFAKPKLQLSNGYFVNLKHLSLILNTICLDQRGRIPRIDLAEKVGFAERQVKQICSIGQAFGLIEQITYKPTQLGRLIQSYDPFFDDIGTLWFLHYIISSNPHNLIWHRMVTQILPIHRSVTREQARSAFDDLRKTLTEYSSQKHVLQELNTVLDAYINQQVARISYLYLNEDTYILGVGEPIPPLVLGACIVCFRDRHRSYDTAISVEDLLNTPVGPGVILQLDERHLRAKLELLKMQPGLSLESRADLDQIRLVDNQPDYMWMERYYVNK